MERKKGPLSDIFKKKIETASSFFTEVWKPFHVGKENHENQSNIPLIVQSDKDNNKTSIKNCLAVQEVFDNGFSEGNVDFLPDCCYGDDQKEYVNDFESLTSVKASELPPIGFILFARLSCCDEGCETCRQSQQTVTNGNSQNEIEHGIQCNPGQLGTRALALPGLEKTSELQNEDSNCLVEPARPPPKPARTQFKLSITSNTYADRNNEPNNKNKHFLKNAENKNPSKAEDMSIDPVFNTVHNDSNQADMNYLISFSLKYNTSEQKDDEYNSSRSSSTDAKNVADSSHGNSELSDAKSNKEKLEIYDSGDFFTNEEGDNEFYSSAMSSDSLSSNTFCNQELYDDPSDNGSGGGFEYEPEETCKQPTTHMEDMFYQSQDEPMECHNHDMNNDLDETDHAYQCPESHYEGHHHDCCKCNQFTRNQHMLYNLANTENLELHDVVPDGNCMFRAIVDQMRMQGEITLTCNQIRQMAVRYLKENPLQEDGTHLEDFFVADGETWEQYLQRMSRDGEWGDQIILRGLSEVIQREICIISTIGDRHNQTSIFPKDHDKEYRKIYLGHVNDQHYYSLRPKGWQNTWYREARRICTLHHKEKFINLDNDAPPIESDFTYPCRPSKLINCSSQFCDKYSHVPVYHLTFVMKNVIQAANIETPYHFYGEDSFMRTFRDNFEFVGSAEEGLAVNLYAINLQSLQGMGNQDFNSPKVTHYPNCYKIVGKHNVIYPEDSYELGSKVVTIDCENTNPGYTRLLLCKHHKEIHFRKINGAQYLRSELYSCKEKSKPEYEDHWKKNNIKPFRKNNSVLFYYNKCPRWPKETNEWTKRNRPSGWPHEALVKELQTVPCVLIPKSHPFSECPDIEWMFDFSFPERLLLKEKISKEQRYCFHVFKLLIDFHTGRMKQLSTFILKTIFLYTLEVLPRQQWGTCPSACVLYMIETLLQSLKERQIPHYFISQNNIIEHIRGEVIYRLAEKVNIVREFPMMSVIIMAESHGIMSTCITDQIIEDLNSNNTNIQDSVLQTFVPAYMKKVSTALGLQKFYESAEAAVSGYRMLQDSFPSESNPYTCMSLDQFIRNATSGMALFQIWWLCFFVDLYKNENTLSSFVTSAKYKRLGDLIDNFPPGDFDDIAIPDYILACYKVDSHANSDLEFVLTLCTFLMKEQQYGQSSLYLRGLAQKVTKYIEDPCAYMPEYFKSGKRTDYMMQTTISSLNGTLFWILHNLYVCYVHLGQTEYFQEYIEQLEVVCDNIASPSNYQILAAIWKSLGNYEKMKEALAKQKNVRD